MTDGRFLYIVSGFLPCTVGASFWQSAEVIINITIRNCRRLQQLHILNQSQEPEIKKWEADIGNGLLMFHMSPRLSLTVRQQTGAHNGSHHSPL